MSRFSRGLVIALVLLAASPLTRPFATCDLVDLFGGDEAPVGAAIKPPSTEEGPALPSVSRSGSIVVRVDAGAAVRQLSPATGRNPVAAPLRL